MKIEEQPYSVEVNLDDTKIFLGLFSFVSIALIQLMAMNHIDRFLIFAEYCFACSLPFLAILIFIKYAERHKRDGLNRYLIHLFILQHLLHQLWELVQFFFIFRIK